MRIGLQSIGTDGDILPFIYLAKSLYKAGHDITLSYFSIDGKDYISHFEKYDIDLIHIDNNANSVMLKNIGRQLIYAKNDLEQWFILFRFLLIQIVKLYIKYQKKYAASAILSLVISLIIT